jgi:hypothetical protein
MLGKSNDVSRLQRYNEILWLYCNNFLILTADGDATECNEPHFCPEVFYQAISVTPSSMHLTTNLVDAGQVP